MARNTGPAWFVRLGDRLGDPLGEFLEVLRANLWIARVVFGGGLLICLVWSHWRLAGLFVGLWALLEGTHALLRLCRPEIRLKDPQR